MKGRWKVILKFLLTISGIILVFLLGFTLGKTELQTDTGYELVPGISDFVVPNYARQIDQVERDGMVIRTYELGKQNWQVELPAEYRNELFRIGWERYEAVENEVVPTAYEAFIKAEMVVYVILPNTMHNDSHQFFLKYKPLEQ